MFEPQLNWWKLCGLLLLLRHDILVNTLMCDRTTGLTVPKSPGNGKFEVDINGGPKNYVPGGIYTSK
jgi:hypothetical protein